MHKLLHHDDVYSFKELFTYPLLEDGNLKPLPSLITVLAIVTSLKSVAN